MRCDGCSFWENVSGSGWCHRYPDPIRSSEEHWCGEYRDPKQAVKDHRNSLIEAQVLLGEITADEAIERIGLG